MHSIYVLAVSVSELIILTNSGRNGKIDSDLSPTKDVMICCMPCHSGARTKFSLLREKSKLNGFILSEFTH